MAIMAGQKLKNPKAGYATDFISVMRKYLPQVLAKKVKVVVNAGGVNVKSCCQALMNVAKDLKVSAKVGIVLGDDLLERSEEFQGSKVEMFTGKPFPAMTVSSNAYLGAFPIAQALREGCDIV